MTYTDKILTIKPANLIALYPLDEGSGTTADNAEGTAGRDGTYSGNYTLASGTAADGSDCPLYGGGNGLTAINGVSGAFDGAELSISIWLRVASSSIWSDFTNRAIIKFNVNASSYIEIVRPFNTGYLRINRAGVATTNTYNITGLTTTDWIHLGITVSETADEVKVYKDGTLLTTMTGLGTWTGSLSATGACIAANDTSVPTQAWNGYISHVALWDTAISASDMADAADPSSGGGATGQLATTLDGLTVSSTGGIVTTGILDVTLGSLTLSSSGSSTIEATTTATLGSLTLSSAATVDVSATSNVTLGSLTSSSTATVAVSGSLSATLGALALSATGNSDNGVTGALAQTLAPLTVSATATAPVNGALTTTLGALTGSSTATVDVTANLGQALGTLTVSGSGVVGTSPASGDLDATLGSLTLSSTGATLVNGTLATTLGALTVSSSGFEGTRTGTLTVTLGSLTLNSTAGLLILATVSGIVYGARSTGDVKIVRATGTVKMEC